MRCIRLDLVFGCVWLARDLRGLARCGWLDVLVAHNVGRHVEIVYGNGVVRLGESRFK